MIVKVTSKHIKIGRHEPTACPVALAIKEVFKLTWVSVGPRRVYTGLTSYGTRLPLEAQYFIQDYDKGQEVKPFKFELE